MTWTHKTSRNRNEHAPSGRHRFEHWLRDNQVYFITSATRGHHPAFATEDAKVIF